MNRNGNMLTDFQRTLAFAALSMIFCAFAAGMVFFCGCTTGNDGIYIDKTVWVYVTNKVDRAVEKHESQGSATGGTAVDVGSSSGAVAEPSSSFSADWRYGGFKGGGAKEVAGCQIGLLNVGSDKLTYKWVSGGCEALGAADKTDYSQTLACAFYWDGKQWVGGKFDWVSTSRTTRTFTNIKEGYNGWNASAFFAAKRHGFCIVSKDGKRRSNFIEQ